MPRDSTTLVARGAWDGARAAESRSARGAFTGGVVSGLLPVWGLAIALPAANRAVVVPEEHRNLMVDTSAVYREAFRWAYSKEARSKRRKSALIGHAVLFPLWVVISMKFGG
ncbi:MAG: hypothetical protein P3B98_03010 [Gemmatimonadota bacterium]|nr:hypothetical protein [Gemmatimonadota bacterium]